MTIQDFWKIRFKFLYGFFLNKSLAKTFARIHNIFARANVGGTSKIVGGASEQKHWWRDQNVGGMIKDVGGTSKNVGGAAQAKMLAVRAKF